MAKEAKKYWDYEEVIGEVLLDDKNKRVITSCEKDGKPFVAVSTWKFYKLKDEPAGAESWRPTGSVNWPTGTAEGQQVFNLIGTMFAAPQAPRKAGASK